jgi:hypothetical protein
MISLELQVLVFEVAASGCCGVYFAPSLTPIFGGLNGLCHSPSPSSVSPILRTSRKSLNLKELDDAVERSETAQVDRSDLML